MAFSEEEVIDLVTKDLMPAWRKERELTDRIDRWMRWDHDSPHSPRGSTREYKELAARSQTPWGDFLVSTLARTLYVEGYRSTKDDSNSGPWSHWQANGFDGRQVALHRSVVGYGTAYGVALPGINPLTKKPQPHMRGISPREMIALYEDPADDEWAYVAMRVAKIKKRAELRIYDDELVHIVDCPDGVANDKFTYRDAKAHGAGVVPVVRYTNRLDLEGRVSGEVEPYIPTLARLDQDTFDRLVTQRFAAWVVRTISGLAKPSGGEEAEAAARLRLLVSDILIVDKPDAKFGSLPASDLKPFVDAHDADIRALSAVSATPAHEMLGSIANLSAEALAAARAPQSAKSDEARHTIGEKHEQFLRLAAHIAGDAAAAADFDSQVRWKDTDIRSLAQAADALGKIATMLGFPVELLWEKIPGMTDQDVETAKILFAEKDGLSAMIREFLNGQSSANPAAAPAAGGDASALKEKGTDAINAFRGALAGE